MEYRNLGSSGLKVSAISLGGNTFGWWIDESASASVIYRALELGINYIDTADMYGKGQSEEFMGKILQGRRDQVIIATKFASATGEGPNDRGGSRYHIRKAVEDSLRRLQTDHIDLYQIHTADPSTPIEETLRAMDDLVHEGKIIYVGCSNFAAWQLADALWTSRVNSLNSFVTVQVKYNFLERQIEQELAPCCKAHGVGVIPWGPLAGGLLTGKFHRTDKPPAVAGRGAMGSKAFGGIYKAAITDANWTRLEKMEAFARERGHQMCDLAIAWLLSHPWLSTVIAGATKPDQVELNVKGASWKLTPEEVAEVEKF